MEFIHEKSQIDMCREQERQLTLKEPNLTFA